jgi:uncharacterized protein YndB with AHSA1/START domain
MSDATRTGEALVIQRQFDAPAEVVWQMWIDPDEFSTWYGPNGASVDVLTWQLRVGGTRLVRMTVPTPRGEMTMWFAGEFLDVVENKRLAYTEYLSDENGNPAPTPPSGAPNPHPTTQVRVVLSEVNGRTTMVLTHAGIPADSPGAVGWTMAMDKLATRLRDDPAS